jgi:hypothetical protein
MKYKILSKITKMKWWKIAALALGIILIAAAGTYALTTRNSAASSGLPDNVPSIGSNTSNTMGIGDLKWTKNLATKFTDHDFIFVILPGSDNDSTTTLTNRVAETAAMVEARSIRVDTMTLSANDPEFSITMDRLAITQLPAVLAISVSGNGAILTGDITVGKLLQTYLVVSQPICAPGSSSGCCGSK